MDEKKPTRRSAFLSVETDYCLAAAAEASAAAPEASAAAPEASAAAPEAAAAEVAALEAAAVASAAAADASAAGAGAAASSFLPQAARATAASSDAIRRDFFIVRPLTLITEKQAMNNYR
ncbi:hypothetical protein [Cupriavidus sp.]|uniref:hypothetical protein n=1 Tax=Cupriavidus sp. TaxID=1873897 RepID=UPI003D0DCBD9